MVGVGGSNPLGRTKFKSPLHAGFFYGCDLSKSLTGFDNTPEYFGGTTCRSREAVMTNQTRFLQQRLWYITVFD